MLTTKKVGKKQKQVSAQKNRTKLQQKMDLQAKLEGAVALARRTKPTRVNWESPGKKEARDRMAQSWLNKKDQYQKGDSFRRFCDRCGIHENVLRRYLKRLENNEPAKKRGRKTLLTEDVMRHICEGWCVYL